MAVLTLDESRFSEILRGDKPVVVEFWAPWCSHCVELASAFDDIAAQYGEQLTFGKVNIDDCPALSEKYFIEFVPTLVIFAEEELIDFVISPGSREAIAQFIEEVL